MIIKGQPTDDVHCACGNDFGGDRLIVADNSILPIIDRIAGKGLDISGFTIDVKTVNLSRYNMAPESKITLLPPDPDDPLKFITISGPNNKPIYWRFIDDPLRTSRVQIDVKTSLGPFTSNVVNGVVTSASLKSNNQVIFYSWIDAATFPLDGNVRDTWKKQVYSWDHLTPIELSDNIETFEQISNKSAIVYVDENDNFIADYRLSFGSSPSYTVNFRLSGNYPGLVEISDPTITVDGKLVGQLYVGTASQILVDNSTPLVMNLSFTLYAEGVSLSKFDKINGLMVLSTVSNEPIAAIELYNHDSKKQTVNVLYGQDQAVV